MNTCQYTGLALANKRAKNHPDVAALLDQAQRRGVYRVVVDAMVAARGMRKLMVTMPPPGHKRKPRSDKGAQ